MSEQLFPILVFKETFPGDIKQLQDLVLTRLDPIIEQARPNNQVAMRNNAVCSALTFENLDDHFDLTELKEFVLESIKKYWKELGYRPNIDVTIGNTWVNRYPPGGYIDSHNHAPSLIGVTFYLKKPTDSGNIVFENPLATLRRFEPFQSLVTANGYEQDPAFNHIVEVEEGDLVLFPGWLTHRTEPNASTEDRVIIAFDILPQE